MHRHLSILPKGEWRRDGHLSITSIRDGDGHSFHSLKGYRGAIISKGGWDGWSSGHSIVQVAAFLLYLQSLGMQLPLDGEWSPLLSKGVVCIATYPTLWKMDASPCSLKVGGDGMDTSSFYLKENSDVIATSPLHITSMISEGFPQPL